MTTHLIEAEYKRCYSFDRGEEAEELINRLELQGWRNTGIDSLNHTLSFEYIQEAAKGGDMTVSQKQGKPSHRTKPPRKSLKTKIKEEWEEFKVYKPLM